MRLLLVEDNVMNREMLSRRLVRRGYEVVIAVDGQDALDKASTEAPDLVLMDLCLPVIDGWEATRRLKAAPATQHIPVLALTAHALPDDLTRAIEAGCDGYETKPVNLDQLISKIRRLCTKDLAGSA